MKKAQIAAISIFLVAVSLYLYGNEFVSAVGVTQVPFPESSGKLDSTFGAGGIVTVSPGAGNDVAQAVAIQADGKAVVAGFSFDGQVNTFALVRQQPNGALDTTFGTGGMVMTPIGPADAEAFGVAIQSDGKIVAAGQASNGSNSDIAVARYNADGTLDTTFDGDGRATIDFGTGNDIARSVALQADGKIVVAGTRFNGLNSDIALARLNADGSLDASFGTGGRVSTPVGTGNDIGYSVIAQPDGKILAAGYYTGPASIDSVILRYNSNGSLDTTFSGDGIAAYAFSAVDVDEALAMALQSDGRIVIAGCIRGNGRLNDYLIARLQTDGSLDPTFGNGGFTIVEFSNSADIAMGVAIQADGKIVAAGFANNGINNDFGVTRVNTDGTLDATFNGNGRQFTMFGSSADVANAVAIQADGKIVVVGRAVTSTADFGIARYGYGTNAALDDGFFDLDATTAVRFENAFRAGTSSVTPFDAADAPPMLPGWSHVGSPRLVATTAAFSGDVLIRLEVSKNIDAANFEAIRILQHEGGVWTDKTASSPPRDFATKSIYASLSALGMIATASPDSPTLVSVSGRVTTPGGLGLRNAVVAMIDSSGTRRTATTSSFGVYSFEGIGTGRTYTMAVASKRYRFAPRVLSVASSLADVDFTGLE